MVVYNSQAMLGLFVMNPAMMLSTAHVRTKACICDGMAGYTAVRGWNWEVPCDRRRRGCIWSENGIFYLWLVNRQRVNKGT